MNKISILFFALFFLSKFCAGQQVDCNKNSNVIAVNQQIRETTYQYVILANDPKYKVNQDTMTHLATAYIAIQTNFNSTFAAMKADKNIFVSKKKICERYSGKLSDLLKQAETYDDRILQIITPGQKEVQFGVSDVLDIIDWIWKKATAPTTFYDQLSWKNWKDVAAGNIDPTSSPVDSSKKKKSK